MCKVSIIVPIYKVAEKFLRKNIESLMKQTLKEIEIILIDDGSPDDCGKICDEYSKIDNRIIVIHQENRGLSAARNIGVKKAKGEWITFVDGDDWIEYTMCEKLYNYSIQNSELEIIISCVIKDYGKKIYYYPYSKLIDKKIYTNQECKYLQKEILDYNGNISGVYAKLIKRNLLINNIIFHNEELRQGAEGIEFNLRLFEKVKKVFFTKEYFYHYMYNDASISSNHNEENHLYVLKCFEKIKEYISSLENKDDMLQMLYNRMIYVIVTTAISGYFNPSNQEKYIIKKEKYIKYLEFPLIKESIKNADYSKIDIKRRIIIRMINLRMFLIINMLGIIRKKQKEAKK